MLIVGRLRQQHQQQFQNQVDPQTFLTGLKRLRLVLNWASCSLTIFSPDSVDGFSDAEASKPCPIQIVTVQDDHSFDLDMDALREVLMSDEVRDKKVAVVSVAGAFRKGKSFLLDYFLRFLNNKVSLFVLQGAIVIVSKGQLASLTLLPCFFFLFFFFFLTLILFGVIDIQCNLC